MKTIHSADSVMRQIASSGRIEISSALFNRMANRKSSSPILIYNFFNRVVKKIGAEYRNLPRGLMFLIILEDLYLKKNSFFKNNKNYSKISKEDNAKILNEINRVIFLSSMK